MTCLDDGVNMGFEICTRETITITDREILDSILIKDCAEVEEEIDEESNDLPPEKLKLSEIARAIELLECWSLFGNNGVEIRQSLSLLSKMFDKHSLETKKQSTMDNFFQKIIKNLLFWNEKTYEASYSKGLLLFYSYFC